MKYRSEIDGLRALSVLAVLFFHSGVGWIRGGFVGVDVFFVISGFLIFGIITREVEAGTFTFGDFYERRFRRIFPALFVVVVTTLIVAFFCLLPSQLEELGSSSVAAIFGLSNFFFMNRVGYFNSETDLMPLIHTWSLGVEEQFYLFAPTVVVICLKLGRTTLVLAILVFAILSFGFAVADSLMTPDRAFFFSPFRFWEILVGGLCATSSQISIRWIWREVLSATGLAFVIFSFLYFDHSQHGSFLELVLPTFGTALVIYFASQGTAVARFLSLRPFVFLGVLSYSIYLWHQPVFAFARILHQETITIWSFICLFGLILSLSLATWVFVEQPFRRKDELYGMKKFSFFGLVLVCCLLVSAFGVIFKSTDGLPSRFTKIPLDNPLMMQMPTLGNGYCFYSIHDDEKLQVGAPGLECILGDSIMPNSKILLFGDSFAGHWEPFWDSFGKDNDASVLSVTTNWCNPSFGEHFIGPKDTRAYKQCLVNRDFVRLNADKFDIIVLSGMWAAVDDQDLIEDFKAAVALILRDSGARVVIMPSPVGLSRLMLERLRYEGVQKLKVSEDSRQDYNKIYQKLIKISKVDDRVMVIDPSDLFGNFEESSGVIDKNLHPYSFDGAHLSVYGSLSAYENFSASSAYTTILALISP